MSITTKVLHVWSHGLITVTLFRWFSRLGITIVPYYFFKESNDFSSCANFKPILDQPFETIFLDRNNVDLIKGFDNLPQVESDFQKLWDKGCSCIGLKSEGSILAYVWFDLLRCNYEYLSFELKNNEAYVFGFHTARHMRGRNIAPFLRVVLCAHLLSLDRNRIYSITERFNTPAMKYKKKIKANPLHYYIYVCLFNRLKKNFKIKTIKDHIT
jgi:hypothetical protein